MMLVALAVPIFATGSSAARHWRRDSAWTLGLTVLLRFGVVAHVAMSVVTRYLMWLPLTLDTDACTLVSRLSSCC